MTGGFVTAEIEPEGQAPFKVCFNPTQYMHDMVANAPRQQVPGLQSPVQQPVVGRSATLSMELFFDTYEDQTDVRNYTDKVYELLGIAEDPHSAPICTFRWGRFEFRGIVERVGGRFTLFLSDGTPVRATLSITFREYVEVSRQVRETVTASADHAKTYTIRRGDTLSSIAAAEYADPSRWRPIALANRITDPRAITPGQVLLLPALT